MRRVPSHQPYSDPRPNNFTSSPRTHPRLLGIQQSHRKIHRKTINMRQLHLSLPRVQKFHHPRRSGHRQISSFPYMQGCILQPTRLRSLGRMEGHARGRSPITAVTAPQRRGISGTLPERRRLMLRPLRFGLQWHAGSWCCWLRKRCSEDRRCYNKKATWAMRQVRTII